MKKNMIAIMLSVVIAAASSAAPVSSAENSSTNKTAEAAAEIEETSTEPAAQEERVYRGFYAIFKEYLDYTDAAGELHTMEVDQSVRENIYDEKKFIADKNDPQWITYSDPEYTVMQGIDVSEHQGTIDWEAVAEAGYSFAFIRVGYRGYGEAGTLCEDRNAVENLISAKDVGLEVGAYFFSQALDEDEAREEAELAVSVIEEADVELDLPLMYDPEIIKNDDGRANDITREQVAVNTQAFKEAVEELSDHSVGIYSNLVWEHELFDAETLNNNDIWYADYENPPQTPYHFTWWQYTEEGSVPGIEGNMDIDLWITAK